MGDHGPVVTVSRVVNGDTIEVAPAVDGPAAENDPKRKFSRRPAVLLPPVVEALRAHRRRQTAERLKLGPRWQEHGYVFPTQVGTPQRGDNILKRSLKPLADALGDPDLNFQKLRRSHSSLYPLLNIHPQVARIGMGHGSIDTTMRYYTAVPPELLKEASETLGELLFGPIPVRSRRAGRPQG